MGRVLGLPCVSEKCEKVQFGALEGVVFNINRYFRQAAADDPSMEMWACCREHKKEAMAQLVREMPLSKRAKFLS